MSEQMAMSDNVAGNTAKLPELEEVEALGNDLKRILVRSEYALLTGDARDNIEKLERWIESYRRGLSAAQKISDNGRDMLQKTRNQLCLSLDELMRMEDEGGNAPDKERLDDSEELATAIRRIDRLMPVVERSFQPTQSSSTEFEAL